MRLLIKFGRNSNAYIEITTVQAYTDDKHHVKRDTMYCFTSNKSSQYELLSIHFMLRVSRESAQEKNRSSALSLRI